MTMNIYRNRLSYDFDSQGNTIDAMVGFNGMNDQGETAMATIKVTQDMLGEGQTFDDFSGKQITELAKQKSLNYIEPKEETKQE